MPDDERSGRWSRRPRWAGALRLAVLCAPVVASVLAAWSVHRLLPPAAGRLDQAGHLGILLATSTLALVLVDRAGRRLLPMVTLLDLTMLFPDRAPSRLRVAREAIRRRPIEEQLARVRDAGADPGAVAREILTLVAALSSHDRPTRGHAERVRMFTDLVAEQMGLPRRDRDLLRWAAILHDIGKLRVPASLLNKPGKPTDDEWTVLRAHPAHGAEMAAGLVPWLGEWGAVIVEHHERYDGTGYPTGLAGTQISIGARIVSVADAYDVMTAARPYKRPVSRAAALRELVRFSGTQFDPLVVRAMVGVGAPRLRRAQGVIAWLADVPIVASGAVPASTVARVVGASALATGAVAGVTTAVPTTHPPAQADTTVAAAQDTRLGPGAGDVGGGSDTGPGPAADVGRAGITQTWPGAPARTGPESGSPADPAGSDVDRELSPAPPGDTAAAAGSAGSGASNSGPASTGGGSSNSGPGGSGSSDLLDTVTGTTGSVVNDPVGTVAKTVGGTLDTVGGVVQDPVGTVTGTAGGVVSDPVGTVTGTLGSLTGGSTSSPSPSPSSTGSSGPGGGGSSGSSGSGSSGSGSSGSGSSGLLGGLLGP